MDHWLPIGRSRLPTERSPPVIVQGKCNKFNATEALIQIVPKPGDNDNIVFDPEVTIYTRFEKTKNIQIYYKFHQKYKASPA